MTHQGNWEMHTRALLLGLLVLSFTTMVLARPQATPSAKGQPASASAPKKSERQDDSFNLRPAKDLLLRPEGTRKAEALAHFVEGTAFEENGELEKALEAYRKVLNVDPGEADLAARVAALLSRQEQFPLAIDILKDAIKVSPQAPAPYLQLAFIYAKYLKKTDQAVEFANRAITLGPTNIEAYQRLFEIELAAGNEKQAFQSLERAAKSRSTDPAFWTTLGKFYSSLVFKPDGEPTPELIGRVNEVYKKAVEYSGDDPAVLKEVADYYASSQQINEAIPLYLRVLELHPDDANAREKLATGFVLTNQRAKAVQMLEEIIKQRPEKYQSYDLLAQIYDDQARALQRDNKGDEAKAAFSKAAANYEQSLLINPGHAITYVRLAELLLGPLKNAERAVTLLNDARRRFPDAPEMTYYLGVALREAKHPQQGVVAFEEALHESELEGGEIATARFYFDFGATAEQAGLYDKAADMFKKSIAIDPANSGEAYNYLGYMWAEHNTHLDEAAEMISRALQIDPNNGAYLDSLGWLEFRQGKFEQALTDLLRAAQNMSREDAVVYEHLGDTYLKLNRVSQALEAWQKAIILDPHNKTLAEKIDNAKTKMSKGNRANSSPLQ
jgi:tetratricopeptide (TPR) repeat protein